MSRFKNVIHAKLWVVWNTWNWWYVFFLSWRFAVIYHRLKHPKDSIFTSCREILWVFQFIKSLSRKFHNIFILYSILISIFLSSIYFSFKDVRKISPKDCPLLVQLNWHTDDREGRFVLKNADVKIQPVKFFEVNQDSHEKCE